MTTSSIQGTIFDIQHFSVSDGPGIRTTVFFKGCPLRCKWCHNPESYLIAPQIMFYDMKCIHCGACIGMCPAGCHNMQNEKHQYRPASCTGCGKCTAVCPSGALKLVGKTVSSDEIVKEILEDSIFYESSGGGLTLSGGEPMLQPAFALDIAQKAKAQGLHVCLETCGFCQPEYIRQILPYIDLFLFDYKMTGTENHLKYTGVSNELILQNLYLIDKLGKDIILRCPMIPGKNINEEHISGIIQVANKLHHLHEIHLEPYHNAGVSKRLHLGMQSDISTITPPDAKIIDSLAAQIATATQAKVRVM